MSTIDERIEKHKQGVMNAERLFTFHAKLIEKFRNKMTFHQNAIANLEAKKKVN